MFTTIRKILKSRPDPEPAEGVDVNMLSVEEAQLVAAFLYQTKLGMNVSPYRDAAFTLLGKIEDLYGIDFTGQAASDVDMTINLLDYNMNVVQSVPGSQVEFDV